MSARLLMAGLAFWLMLTPGDRWSWIIVGGHDSREDCEQARLTRPDGASLVCAGVPDSWAPAPTVADTQPHDLFPWLGGLK